MIGEADGAEAVQDGRDVRERRPVDLLVLPLQHGQRVTQVDKQPAQNASRVYKNLWCRLRLTHQRCKGHSGFITVHARRQPITFSAAQRPCAKLNS